MKFGEIRTEREKVEIEVNRFLLKQAQRKAAEHGVSLSDYVDFLFHLELPPELFKELKDRDYFWEKEEERARIVDRISIATRHLVKPADK